MHILQEHCVQMISAVLDMSPPFLYRVADIISRFLSYCIVEESHIVTSSNVHNNYRGSVEWGQYIGLFGVTARVWLKYITVFPSTVVNKVQYSYV